MRYLSGKDKKNMVGSLPKNYTMDKKDEVYIDNNVVFKNNNPYLVIRDNKYIPHINSQPNSYPCVYIDRGAIPFLLKGADMMRPGITTIEGEFEKDELIVIKDEEHKKILGIGYSLNTSDEMKKQESGKAINVIHYFNDSYFH